MRGSDIAASDAARREKFSSRHARYLEGRGLLEVMGAIGARSLRSRSGEFIGIPYGQDRWKVYDPDSPRDPWRQWKPEGSRLPLWRLDEIDFGKPWVLTEGEWDAATACAAGFWNTTSLPDGAVQPGEEKPAQSGKLAAIREAWGKIVAARGECILALDNDAPGQATRDVLVEILGRWRCRVVEYPKHHEATGADGRCKDLNEVWKLLGHQEVRATLERSRLLKLEGVYKPSEIKRGPKRDFFDIGLEGFGEHCRLFRGGLMVLTGFANQGKTTLLLYILGMLAKQNLKICAMLNEADFWEDIVPWYERFLFGVDSQYHQPFSKDTRDETIAWLEENFVFVSKEIEPLSKPASIEWYIEQVMNAKGRYNIDVNALDPWNKIQHSLRHNENDEKYICRALAEIHNLQKLYQMIGIILAHPRLEAYKIDGKPRAPRASEISGAAHWINGPDSVLVNWKPERDKNMAVIIADKAGRAHGSGKQGQKVYTFNPWTNHYLPADAEMVAKYG